MPKVKFSFKELLRHACNSDEVAIYLGVTYFVFKGSGSVPSSGYMYYAYLDMVGIASSELWDSRQFI